MGGRGKGGEGEGGGGGRRGRGRGELAGKDGGEGGLPYEKAADGRRTASVLKGLCHDLRMRELWLRSH